MFDLLLNIITKANKKVENEKQLRADLVKNQVVWKLAICCNVG